MPDRCPPHLVVLTDEDRFICARCAVEIDDTKTCEIPRARVEPIADHLTRVDVAAAIVCVAIAVLICILIAVSS